MKIIYDEVVDPSDLDEDAEELLSEVNQSMEKFNRGLVYAEVRNTAEDFLEVAAEIVSRMQDRVQRRNEVNAVDRWKTAADIHFLAAKLSIEKVFYSIGLKEKHVAYWKENVRDPKAVREFVQNYMSKIMRNDPRFIMAVLSLFIRRKYVTRFEVFQVAGAFPGREFSEWANEYSGVKEVTWRQWLSTYRVFFKSEAGLRVREKLGMSPEKFAEVVPMDKAARTKSKVLDGTIEEHQAMGLIDEEVTSREQIFRLSVTSDEWEERTEESEKDWIENGDREMWFVYDELSDSIRLFVKEEDGKLSSHLVVTFPASIHGAHPLIESVKDEIISFIIGLNVDMMEMADAKTQ